ncbi:MAG: hypothetical protein AAGE98_19375, partial [Actinomycetota bacterium]
PSAMPVGTMPPSSSNDGSACVEAPSPFDDLEAYILASPDNEDATTVHVLTNDGETPLAGLTVVDDNGTPDDTDDDRYRRLAPHGGDDGDGVFEPGEEWRIVFYGPVGDDLIAHASFAATDADGVGVTTADGDLVTIRVTSLLSIEAPTQSLDGPVAGFAGDGEVVVGAVEPLIDPGAGAESGDTSEASESGSGSGLPVSTPVAAAGGVLAAAAAAVALGGLGTGAAATTAAAGSAAVASATSSAAGAAGAGAGGSAGGAAGAGGAVV